jgi:uncharacterized membrane protein (DUF4010 family)
MISFLSLYFRAEFNRDQPQSNSVKLIVLSFYQILFIAVLMKRILIQLQVGLLPVLTLLMLSVCRVASGWPKPDEGWQLFQGTTASFLAFTWFD